jgi:type I restriction enzyme S subunit
MKYPAYPKYKESGVEWLGEIPEDWDIKKTSLLFSAKKGSSAAQLTKEYCATIEGEFPVFSGQTENDGIMALINTYEFDSGCNGFLFSTTVGAKAMSLMHVKGKFSLSQNCMVIIPLITSIDIRFYYYHMQPLFSFERGLIPEHMQASFRMEDLYAYRIALPSFSTQQIIASFLDTETAKIDGLIKDYEELITLLQEKRQALISHAVTRGLSELVSPDDPEFGEWAKPVKFKDSGVEWLGEIPEEWVIKSIKWITPVQRGASPRPIDDPKYFDEDGEYAWVRISDVTSSQDGYLRATTDQLSELGASLSVKIEPGSLFISIAGTVGKPCIAKIKACIHDGFVYFPLLDINPKYLFRVFESGSCYGGLGKFGTQLNLNTDTIGSIKIGVPPVNEIENILLFLDKELSKIDSLILETESAISLLKEYRSALITNAVTGKINVEALV